MDMFILRAIELAQKGIGFTSPNPAVGAVIVKNGKIIGEGWHKKAGGPHAEVVAIKKTEVRSPKSGSSILYVTFEPCCHTGKTPPCTDAIIASGIKSVVVGMVDSLKHTNTKGIQALRSHGISVHVLNKKTVLAKEIRLLNQPFIKWAKTGLPYVIMKSAVSLDGKIATRTGESKWITGSSAREDARLERSMCDAVLVGAGTVMADDPELAAHGVHKKKQLLRVIIDPELSLPLSKKVFRPPSSPVVMSGDFGETRDMHVLVACTDRAIADRRRVYEKQGIQFQSFGKTRVNIRRLLAHLGTVGIQSIFVEGGAGIHGAFHDAGVIDKVIFYIAPKIIGGEGALSAVGGAGTKLLDETLQFQETSWKNIGDDMKFVGRVNEY